MANTAELGGVSAAPSLGVGWHRWSGLGGPREKGRVLRGAGGTLGWQAPTPTARPRERKADFHRHRVRVTFPGTHCLLHSRPPVHLRISAGRERFRGEKKPLGLFQAMLQNSSVASLGKRDTRRKLRSHDFLCVLAHLSVMLSGGGFSK